LRNIAVMSLRFSVDHPNRVIVAVGRGEVTLADLAQFPRRTSMRGQIFYADGAADQISI
jgi:hypothetical protein